MALQSAENSGQQTRLVNRRLSGWPVFPFRWPVRLLGPCPGVREISLVCWGLFIGLLVIPLGFVLLLQLRHVLSCDFVYFYGIGNLFNTHSSAGLYNLGLQLQTFNHIAPPQGGIYGPSPYPPFVAQFFSLFAHLSFKLAYLLWLAVSLALYLSGISLIARDAFATERLGRSLTFCFGLAFPPFILNTLSNGQISSIAFFFVCLAWFFDRRQQPVISGLALSVVAYKPTLLLLLLPMLLLTRRMKTLLGFLGGLTLLLVEITLADGAKIWPVYLRFLEAFKHLSSTDGNHALRRWQFVDLNSFLHALPSGQSGITLVIFAIVAIAVAAWLARLLWISSDAVRPVQQLVWASTLTWTLLLNIYVPVYDSVLVVISATLTLGALNEIGWIDAERWTTLICMLIFVVAWIDVPLAKHDTVQLSTIVFFGFGIVQLYFLRQALRALSPNVDPQPDFREGLAAQ